MAKRVATPVPSVPVTPLAWGLVAIAVAGMIPFAVEGGLQAQAVDFAAIIVGFGTAVVTLWLLLSGRASWPASRRLTIAGAALLGWLAVAALASGRVWSALMGEPTSLLGVFSVVCVAAVALTASAVGQDAYRAMRSAAPLIVAVQWVITMYRIMSSDLAGSTRLGMEAAGTLPNSTYLGEAMLLLLPFCAPRAGDSRNDTLLRMGAAAGAIVVLAAGGSRVAAAIAILWFVWAVVSRSNLSKQARFAVIGGLAVVVVSAGLFFARSELLGTFGVSALGQRPEMWRVASIAVAERPLLGYGADGFVAGGASISTPELGRDGALLIFRPGAIDPHNLLISLALAGGVLAVGLFVWLAIEIVLNWRARARAGLPVAESVWAVVGLFVILLTAPVALQVLPLFAVVLGLSITRREEAPEGMSGIALSVTLAVLALVAIVFGGNALTRLPLEATGPEAAVRGAASSDRASSTWRVDPYLYYLASLHLGYAASANPAIAQAQPDLVAIERAAALDRRTPWLGLERARTLQFYGAPAANVDTAFQDAFRRWPLYPVARAEYAIFLAQQGRLDEAKRNYELAVEVGSGDAEIDRAVEAARDAIEAASAK